MARYKEPFADKTEPHHLLYPDPELSPRWRDIDAERLRETVDSLPRPLRHVAESLFWERTSLALACRRLGLPKAAGAYLLTRLKEEVAYRYSNPVQLDVPLARRVERHATLYVDGLRPSIYVASRAGVIAPELHRERVRGARDVLRFLDRVEGGFRWRVTRQRAGLLREFAESRLVRPRGPITSREKVLREALQD